MSPQAQKLKDILNLLSDSLTKKDFLDAFKAVTEYVKKVDTRTASEVAQIKDMLTSTMERLKELHKEEVGSLESSMSKKMESDMNKMLLEHEAMMAECDKKMAEMKDGEDGMDADEEKIVADVLAKLPPPKELAPETPESVRDKLETLEGEERLDASAIKNLPKAIKQERIAFGHPALWALADVDVSGIVSGQSIRWDGIQWIPYTPAGGATTPVFEEIPTDSGDHLNFTILHTPVANTMRLYRGGGRLLEGVGKDYTISGTTITLATALQTGEVIFCDYDY